MNHMRYILPFTLIMISINTYCNDDLSSNVRLADLFKGVHDKILEMNCIRAPKYIDERLDKELDELLIDKYRPDLEVNLWPKIYSKLPTREGYKQIILKHNILKEEFAEDVYHIFQIGSLSYLMDNHWDDISNTINQFFCMNYLCISGMGSCFGGDGYIEYSNQRCSVVLKKSYRSVMIKTLELLAEIFSKFEVEKFTDDVFE